MTKPTPDAVEKAIQMVAQQRGGLAALPKIVFERTRPDEIVPIVRVRDHSALYVHVPVFPNGYVYEVSFGEYQQWITIDLERKQWVQSTWIDDRSPHYDAATNTFTRYGHYHAYTFDVWVGMDDRTTEGRTHEPN